MDQYALFRDGVFEAVRAFNQRPPHISHRNVQWFPVGTAVEGETVGWSIINDEAVVTIPLPPMPTKADVTDHAEHLIEHGVTINITGIAGPAYLQGRAKDKDNIAGLKDGALLRQMQSQPSPVTVFRDGNNIMHALNDGQLIELWAKGAAYVQAVYAVSFDMKDNDTVISRDFRDDARWPNADQTDA